MRVVRRSKAFGRLIVLVAALAAVGDALFAQSPEAPPPPPGAAADNGWHYLAGLYGWFPGMSGSVSTRNFPEVPIDVPFSTIFDHLKFGLTGHFEGGKDRFGFGLDFMYVHVGAPVSGQIPELLDASVNLRELIAEGFGYYRIAQGAGEHPWKLELLGGVRFWDINTRLESNVTDASGKTVDWADGFGGLRVEFPIGGSGLSVVGRGDVGAGGAKLDWSASGDLAYRAGKGWILGAGYRTLNVDYDKSGQLGVDRRLFDVSMNGPRVWILYSW